METKDLLSYAQMDIFDTKKEASVLKTGLSLKTKNGHRVTDLLEL